MDIDYEIMMIKEGPVLNFWANTFHQERDLTFNEIRRTYRDFLKFEREVQQMQNVIGWITWVKHEHKNVQKIVERLGGKLYVPETQRAWYVKFKEGV